MNSDELAAGAKPRQNYITQARLEEFLAELKAQGATAGNRRLRQKLKWSEDFYWRVQSKLIEQNRIKPGRGKGGSVRVAEIELAPAEIKTADEVLKPTLEQSTERGKERALYRPFKTAIEKWVGRFGFDELIVEETHSLGRRDTGGTFTRPDITAAGVRRYEYLPKRLEIVTFEIKPGSVVNIMGVLEAIAHREAAHRSYVIYACSRGDFENSAEEERISDLAQKYGVGVVLAETPDSIENWEVWLDDIRHEPDPGRVDRFLNDLPNETMKRELRKWK